MCVCGGGGGGEKEIFCLSLMGMNLISSFRTSILVIMGVEFCRGSGRKRCKGQGVQCLK